MELLLSEHPVDVCCITEHWLKPHQMNVPKINNHKVLSTFYRKEYKNGGTIILVRDKVMAEEIAKVVRDKVCECCAVTLKIKKKKYL